MARTMAAPVNRRRQQRNDSSSTTGDSDRDCANCADSVTKCDQRSSLRCVWRYRRRHAAPPGQDVHEATACARPRRHVRRRRERRPDHHVQEHGGDCGACGPKFRVCDTCSGKCVGCSTTEHDELPARLDTCDAQLASCAAECPAACGQDSDCGQRGTTAKPAHAWNAAHAARSARRPMACAYGGNAIRRHRTAPA